MLRSLILKIKSCERVGREMLKLIYANAYMTTLKGKKHSEARSSLVVAAA